MLSYMKSIIISAFSPTLWKTVLAICYVFYMFSFDVSKSSSYVSLLILIGLDFVTSLWAAKITGQPIRSSKIGNTGVKVFAYFAVICGAFQVERGLISQISVLDETVLAFFMARELISLIENVGRMGYAVPQKVLNQLKDFTNKE